MPSISCPEPKTQFGRPPIEPPIRTTFDSSSNGDDDPLHRQYAEDIKRFLASMHDRPDDFMPIMLVLIRTRMARLEQELRFERLLSYDRLPPLLRNLYSLEGLFDEDEATRTYAQLLSVLRDAEQTVVSRMRDLNMELPASES